MMAHAITFDTLAFAKKLEKAGIEKEKSEAIAEALTDVFENNISTTVFTKKDAEVLKSEIKNELVMWFVGLLFAQTALILTCIKLFH